MCGLSSFGTTDAALQGPLERAPATSFAPSTYATVPSTPAPIAHFRLRSVAAALKRSLPPAEVIQLDAGYLVVRRRHAPARDTNPRPPATKHVRRQCADAAFLRQVEHLRLMARARLALPKGLLRPQAGPEARFVAAFAAAAVAHRALCVATHKTCPGAAAASAAWVYGRD